MNTKSPPFENWKREFPLLERFKNGRKLLRIQSPIIWGIELEKFLSDTYRPNFVALNLLSSFPEFAINRTLRTDRCIEIILPYAKPEVDFELAVEILRENFPLLGIRERFNEQEFINAYRSAIDADLEESASPLAIWLSLVQLLIYFRREEEARLERMNLEKYLIDLGPTYRDAFDDLDGLLKQELDVTAEELERRKDINLTKAGWESVLKEAAE